VIPTEIQSLKDLEAYIKLPGNYPITKLKMDYKNLLQRINAFDISPFPRNAARKAFSYSQKEVNIF